MATVFLGIIGCDEEEDDDITDSDITINEDITTPTTWEADKTWIVSGNIMVHSDLTIEPGTTVYFKEGASLYVGAQEYGSILAVGEEDNPIIFTSASTNPGQGDWGQVHFGTNNSSTRTNLAYCQFKYGGYDECGMVELYETQIKMNNCTLSHAAYNGLIVGTEAKFISFSNNIISNCGTHPVKIDINAVHTIDTTCEITGTNSYGIEITESEIHGIYTWYPHESPYYVPYGIWIDASSNPAELTLKPGCILKMGPNMGINVGNYSYAKFIANGTLNNPITITSSAASPSAGDWSYIWFGTHTSQGTMLNYCNISYGGSEYDNGMIVLTETDNVSITNCNISYSDAHGIYLYLSNPTLLDNIFSNITRENIWIEE